MVASERMAFTICHRPGTQRYGPIGHAQCTQGSVEEIYTGNIQHRTNSSRLKSLSMAHLCFLVEMIAILVQVFNYEVWVIALAIKSCHLYRYLTSGATTFPRHVLHVDVACASRPSFFPRINNS